jgi:trimeric autotransporter adhesin
MKSLVTKLPFSLCSLVVLSLLGMAQAQTSNPGTATVPRLVRFGGNATDATGKPLTGTVGATFAIYKEQQGGAALWLETQNVTADKGGRYSALLGSSKTDGLPMDLFASGEARWVGVTIEGQSEQPRVLLSSVPYAMKAGDAETLGGKPASAFLQLLSQGDGNAKAPVKSPTVHGSGTANTVPLFTAASTIGNSVITQSGANIGIGKSTPAATLDVNGTANFSGVVSFASGQTFPGAGTVTNVGMTAPSSDFTVSGSPITKSGTLGLNWNVAPTSANTANAIVKRDASGNFSSGTITALELDAGYVGVSGGLQVIAPLSATGPGLLVESSNNGYPAITSIANATLSGRGLVAYTAGTDSSSYGIAGEATSRTGTAIGTYGESDSPSGTGVLGILGGILSKTGGTAGTSGRGVWGDSGPGLTEVGVLGTTDSGAAFYGLSNGGITALFSNESTSSGDIILVASGGAGGRDTITGDGTVNLSDPNGDHAYIGDPGCGPGFFGIKLGGTRFSGCTDYTLLGSNDGNTYINSSSNGAIWIRNKNANLVTIDHFGNMVVAGNLSKGGGSFKIDHPLDPANKYLYHSFVESPDMMNVYNGNIVTDAHGRARVQLPDYFQALNRDFRYQLTVIGQFAQAIVQRKVENNRFTIRTSKPGVEVSWQVTGIRQDAWANAHRIPNEVEKPAEERGHYLHPELFGAPEELRMRSTSK